MANMKVALTRYKHTECVDRMFDGMRRYLEGLGLQVVDVRLQDWEAHKDADVVIGTGAAKPCKRGRLTKAVMGHMLETGGRYICVESGALMRDTPTPQWSVGWDGLCGRGRYNNQNSPPDRLERLGITPQPWRRGLPPSAPVVLTLQLPWDAAVYYLDYPKAVNRLATDVLASTERRLIIKQHPLYGQRRDKYSKCVPDAIARLERTIAELAKRKGVELAEGGCLADMLKSAWCLATVNSTSATDAVIAGVPAIVVDEGSFAWPMCAHSGTQVENPVTPDREQWLRDMAYTQWSPDEMDLALAHLGIS